MSVEVILRELTTGFGQTMMIFALTLVFSLPLGMVVYFGRTSRFWTTFSTAAFGSTIEESGKRKQYG